MHKSTISPLYSVLHHDMVPERISAPVTGHINFPAIIALGMGLGQFMSVIPDQNGHSSFVGSSLRALQGGH